MNSLSRDVRKEKIAVFFIIFFMLAIAFILFAKIKPLTGLTVMDEAEVIAGKETYYVGDMAHLFIFPSSSDYSVEVYDPEGRLYANSINFPVEKAGEYKIKVLVSAEGQQKEVSTLFNVIEKEKPKKEIEEVSPGEIEGAAENASVEEATGSIIENLTGEITTINFTVEKIDENITVNITETNVSLFNATPVANVSTPINISAANATELNTSTAAGAAIFMEEDIEFDEDDMIEEAVRDKNNRDIKITRIEKGNVKIKVTGAGKKSIKNAWYRDGVLHIDSVPIKDAAISLPRKDSNPVGLPPKLYIKEEGETEFKEAKPYQKDGVLFNSVETTSTNYIFNVEHFTSYSINTTGGFLNLAACLKYINNTANDCTINSAGYYDMNYWNINASDAGFNKTGLILAYDFDEDAVNSNITDWSDRKRNATVWGTINRTIGYYANGTVFDGTAGNYINSTVPIMPALNTMTYGGWINFKSLREAGSGVIIMHQYNSSDAIGDRMDISATSETEGNVMCEDINCGATSTTILTSNTWYNIFCVRNSTDLCIWVNGVLENCGVSGAIANNGTNFIIGKLTDYISFNGTIDQVRVWNRSLTKREIEQQYAGGIYRYNISPPNFSSVIKISVPNVILNLNNSVIIGRESGVGLSAEGDNADISYFDLRNFTYGMVIASNTSNVTNNSIWYSGAYDLNLTSTSNYTRVSLNSLYSKGIQNTGAENVFCVNGSGNFYRDIIPWANIGSGDCGIMNLTYPKGGETFANRSQNIKINWSRQSSPKTLTYYVYYSNDAGSTWYDVASTSGLEYNWDVSSMLYDTDYQLRIFANDGSYNSTENRTTSLTIGNNNNYVCSDIGICEYRTITDCLLGENNTANGCILYQNNTFYAINASLRFNMTAKDSTLIQFNGTNQTLLCNGSQFYGAGKGVFANNTLAAVGPITIEGCIISNYTNAILLDNLTYGTISNVTIMNSTKNAMLIKNSTYINITNSTFKGTNASYFDINLTGSNQTRLWLNNFYTKGVAHFTGAGINNTFCTEGWGNFYLFNITWANIGPDDCGPANLTRPSAGSAYARSINITWRKQSSAGALTYYLYYSNNAGLTWYGIGSTTGLNYSWDISSLTGGSNYKVRIWGYDGYYNGTQNDTGTFTILDNNWVCSNSSICEYQDITSALKGENNTASNITLMDANAVYTINGTYKFNISVDVSTEGAIIINGTNITLNCNGSEIRGAYTGYGIYAPFNNLTIKNCKMYNFSIGIYLENSNYSNVSNNIASNNSNNGIYINTSYNNTFTNNTAYNNGYGISLDSGSERNIFTSNTLNNNTANGLEVGSSNNIITGNNVTANTEYGIHLTGNANNTVSSNNVINNSIGIALESSTNNTIISNTLTRNGIYGISLDTSSYNTITSNTIRNTYDASNDAMGIYASQSNNLTISGNTLLDNHEQIYVFESSDISITGNTLNNQTGNNVSSYTSCPIFISTGSMDLSGIYISSNTVSNSSAHSICAYRLSGAKTITNLNLTGNTIYNTSSGYFDLFLGSGVNSARVWLNSFYGNGVNDTATSTNFCIASQGNFYRDTIARNYIGSNDCGPINITGPDSIASYKGTIKVNWSGQSSPTGSMKYYFYYSNDSGSSWNYLSSTISTNYQWATTWLWNYSMSNMMVKVIPYDGTYNGTPDNSTTAFNITVNNNWVCNNASYCEYLDISSALQEQNNTAEVITLMDSNTVYRMNNSLAYNLSTTDAAINISKDNITFDCNNALLMSTTRGIAVYASNMNNITIKNCRIYNYSYGITLLADTFAAISNSTINSSKQAGINLSYTNKSTVESTPISSSIYYNIMLDRSMNNTLRYINATGSSQYGIYLKSSSYNAFVSVNSSASGYENMYIDEKSDNNTIENSTFMASSRHSIYLAGDRNNISTSSFANTSSGYFDMTINGSASTNAIWLNNFYTGGVNDTGQGTVFCVNRSGNYYNPNISSTFRPVGSCGNLSVAYLDKDGDGYYTIYDCNDFNPLFYPGAVEYCDDGDNDCDGAIDEGDVCVKSTFRSSGTGGGSAGGAGVGGGGFAITTYKNVNIQETPSFLMGRDEEAVFTIKGAEHRLRLEKVYEDHASIAISSEEQKFDIYVNETKKIDLDNDNVFDLSIKLTEIIQTKVNFYLQVLEPTAEQLPQKGETPEQKPAEQQKIEEKPLPTTVETITSTAEEITRISKKPFIIAGIILLIMGIISSGFVYYRNVVRNIKPMEEFIETALAKGYPKGRIKKELIETGWDEPIVDSVLGTQKEMHSRKELRNYIEGAVEKGFTKEQIKDALVKRGWKDNKVDELFK